MSGEKEKCPYECRQDEEIKKSLTFQGSVLQALRNIEAGIQEIKDNRKADNKEVWEAINEIRRDIRNLYWKVGLIAGGCGVLTSLIFRFLKG